MCQILLLCSSSRSRPNDFPDLTHVHSVRVVVAPGLLHVSMTPFLVGEVRPTSALPLRLRHCVPPGPARRSCRERAEFTLLLAPCEVGNVTAILQARKEAPRRWENDQGYLAGHWQNLAFKPVWPQLHAWHTTLGPGSPGWG